MRSVPAAACHLESFRRKASLVSACGYTFSNTGAKTSDSRPLVKSGGKTDQACHVVRTCRTTDCALICSTRCRPGLRMHRRPRCSKASGSSSWKLERNLSAPCTRQLLLYNTSLIRNKRAMTISVPRSASTRALTSRRASDDPCCEQLSMQNTIASCTEARAGLRQRSLFSSPSNSLLAACCMVGGARASRYSTRGSVQRGCVTSPFMAASAGFHPVVQRSTQIFRPSRMDPSKRAMALLVSARV
mmetsp:Transcript_42082/g.116255  ORF Transcript_42082/g.116255 Transcript_42082/m.116255 type:complete len:245 (+) Transcript_42082:269-1003(+)